MAITLPAVLVLYEICFRKHKVDTRLLAFYGVLGFLSAVYGYSRLLTMSSRSPSDPYYMDLSILTFGRGYGWYFDHLYGMKLRWAAWIITVFLLAVLFVYRRERRGLFF